MQPTTITIDNVEYSLTQICRATEPKTIGMYQQVLKEQ